MKRIVISLFAVVFIFQSFLSFADEGMWIISLINKNYEDMKKQGLKLSIEDIYNINHTSIKDAVVQFGRGCTGEVVSDQGLLFTNYHCGFGQIQAHSSPEQDFIADGYFAKNKSEELPNEGLTVKFLIRIDDVTDAIFSVINKTMSYEEKQKAIREKSEELTRKATEGTNYTAFVKSFFTDNQYLMLTYKIYRDVRLVGAPPQTIGKFGGDTDNWMWPRHTADFSVFRIYADINGEPADYSPKNIPLKPKHFLPISLKGMHQNDFAMIIGYPGSTDRYKPSFGVKQALDVINPAIIKIRTLKLAILKKHMDASRKRAQIAKDYSNLPKVHIQYASKYARTSNYWKYFIGQNKGIHRLHVIEKKQAYEKKFSDWISQKQERKEKYGNVLQDLEKTYAILENYYKLRWYIYEAGLRGPDGISFARKMKKLEEWYENQDKVKDLKTREPIIADLRKTGESYFKDFDLSTEIDLFGQLIQMINDDIIKDYHPTIFSYINKKYKGDFSEYARDAYVSSLFRSKKAFNDFLDNPSLTKLHKDPVYKVMESLTGCLNKFKFINKTNLQKMKTLRTQYMAGILEMEKGENLYPDANLTMRLTYGTVQPYKPADAVDYDYYTTLKGIYEKSFSDNPDYDVPDKLLTLYKTKDYGKYGENGQLRTCFLTNNDITGGNSGSPVINGKGELVGLAFDGNWEA
ncbi:MAG TPA: S46 family peptidase, partial [Bacteroidales bacterium]|nr:S46 family peptidase [Bacteroidales bacterium]